MVKMDLGNSDSQASSTATVTGNHIVGYQRLINSLETFSETAELEGFAYTSAKTYATAILIPVVQAAILLSEQISVSTSKLPSDYRTQVSSESLDSEVLESQIASYTAAYNKANEWLNQELTQDVLDERDIMQAEKAMSRNLSKKNELEEKLRKLIDFDNISSGIFSDIDSLFKAYTEGMSQVKKDFENFKGTFTLPPIDGITWLDTIKTYWNIRTERVRKDLDVIYEKMYQGEPLTEREVQIYNQNTLDGLRYPLDYNTMSAFSMGVQNKCLINNAKPMSNSTSTGSSFFDYLDYVFGYENTLSKEFAYTTNSGEHLSAYSKQKVKNTTKNSGFINFKADNGVFSGLGIDLGVLSLDVEMESLPNSYNIPDMHLNTDTKVNLFGYTGGVKQDVGFSSETGIEGDLAVGLGSKNNDISNEDYLGVKLSTDISDGVLGFYHQHTDSKTEGEMVTTTQTETGFQTLNGGDLLVVGVAVGAVAVFVFAPEIAIPALTLV